MEQWKQIPGYEGLYEASTLGRIRTVENKITSNALYCKRVWKQRILTPKKQMRSNGRYYDERVDLWKNGKHKTLLVSRLVAMTFCDGYFDGATVNHINGNPTDNTVENLEWTTRCENIQKGYSTGLYDRQKKRVICIETGEVFESMSDAERKKGICKGAISAVCATVNATAGGYHWKRFDDA